MSPRSRARLVSLAALLPLLVVAVSGFGYDRMRCTFTGEVMSDSGCCPAEDAPATPVANAVSCCEHESGRTTKLPAVAAASHELAAASAAPPVVPQLAPPPAPTERARAPRPTSHAPPVPPLLLKQSFLI